MLSIIGRFQAQVLSAISNIKYWEYVLLIIWPQLTFRPWNFWDPDINNPAHIPIIAHAYLLLTLSSMHALSSPPGINYLTHRNQPARYNLTVRTRKTRGGILFVLDKDEYEYVDLIICSYEYEYAHIRTNTNTVLDEYSSFYSFLFVFVFVPLRYVIPRYR
jgi:hypothetical protein